MGVGMCVGVWGKVGEVLWRSAEGGVEKWVGVCGEMWEVWKKVCCGSPYLSPTHFPTPTPHLIPPVPTLGQAEAPPKTSRGAPFKVSLHRFRWKFSYVPWVSEVTLRGILEYNRKVLRKTTGRNQNSLRLNCVDCGRYFLSSDYVKNLMKFCTTTNRTKIAFSVKVCVQLKSHFYTKCDFNPICCRTKFYKIFDVSSGRK